MPGDPDEDHRDTEQSEAKKTLTRLRSKTTRTVYEIESMCPETGLESQRKVDELSFVVEEAKLLRDELNSFTVSTQAKESDHLRSLSMAIHIANKNIERWEVNHSKSAVSPPQTSAYFPPVHAMAKLEIPKFGDGKTEWSQFWGLFKHAVHENPLYGPAEKVALLIPLLVGRAASAVAGILLEPRNYDTIISILDSRFNRPDERRRTLLHELYTFPSMNFKALEQQRKSVDRLVAIIRELVSIGVDPATFSTAIDAHLESCLPGDWRTAWIRQRRKQDTSIDTETFMSFLLEEMEVAEQRGQFARVDKVEFSYQSSPNKSSASSSVSMLPSFTTNQMRKCAACNANVHSLTRCDAFLAMTPRQRDQTVRTAHLCFNCLGPHNMTKCKSTFTCNFCRKRHHTLLCFRNSNPQTFVESDFHNSASQQTKFGRTGTRFVHSKPTIANTTTVGTELNAQSPPFVSMSNTSAPPLPNFQSRVIHSEPCLQASEGVANIVSFTSASSAISSYCMVAICHAYGSKGNRLVRLMFDSGADCSFIRSEVAVDLGLPIVETGVFACIGFRGLGEERQQRSKLACTLVSRFGGPAISVNLWAVDKICGSMKARNVPNHEVLSNVPLADDFTEGEVDIIIGNDLFYSLVKSSHIRLSRSLRALDTVFGWVLHGVDEYVPANTDPCTGISHVSCLRVSSAWDLEGLGIQPEPEEFPIKPMPVWDEQEQKVRVSLLWASEDRPFSNFDSAANRVERMFSRLTPDQQVRYDEFIVNKVSDKVIAKSPESWRDSDLQFFLPHRPLLDGKFRAVFDGSAIDGRGRPLNSYMCAGPNALQNLITVLIRFRSGNVGLQADIKSAFHQVMVDPVDWPFIQFPYREDVLHFRRLPFGLICSPSLLHASVDFVVSRAESFQTFTKDLTSKLRHGLYFDDLLIPFASRSDAEIGIAEACEVFETGGMTLHKVRMSGDDTPASSILGLIWDTSSDRLFVRTTDDFGPVHTKRALMSVIGRIWDPLGLLSPWTIKIRLIFQKTWTLVGLTWNDTLPSCVLESIMKWLSEVSDIKLISVPRLCALPPFRIDCFVDASSVACCAVVYLVDANGSRQFLLSKSRLAPIKKSLSIPRLELIAALIGSRLVKVVKDSLSEDVTGVRFYSDSQDVLFWLQKRRQAKVFVSNRVNEILASSRVEEWYYVRSEMNPADLGTRGMELREIVDCEIWWHGPPSSETVCVPFVNREFSKPPGTVELLEEEASLGVSVPIAIVDCCPDPVIDLSRFSSLCSALRATAYVLRVVNRLKNIQSGCLREPISLALSREDIDEAHMFLLRLAQNEFMNEKRIRQLAPLHPFEGRGGIMYISPRTGEAERAYLPPESEYARLVIMNAHQQAFHMGTSATSSVLSARYHTPRSAIRKTISTCRQCRRYRGLPFRGEEGSLPTFRTELTRAFASVGIDHFGPLLVNGHKKYVLIIVCSSSRAIHLELVDSLSAQDAARALRKFMAIRGHPNLIISDNAKTFKLLSSMLEVKWKFLPERAPWWGGFYERMVGITKRAIRTTLHGVSLSADEMRTVLYELSLFVNLRPLTPLEDSTALTPAHFLYGASVDEVLNPHIRADVPLTRAWRLKLRISNHLKKRWYREYLPTLRCWNRPTTGLPVRVPHAGDVVLVHQDGRPRGKWPVAKIESLIVGPDGRARAAFVLSRGLVTRRPLQRLYYLEAAQLDPDQEAALQDGGSPARDTSPASHHDSANHANPHASDLNHDNAQGIPGSDVDPVPLTRRGRPIQRPARYRD